MDRRAVYVLTHPYRGNRYLNGTTREMKGRFPYALLQASACLTEGGGSRSIDCEPARLSGMARFLIDMILTCGLH